VTRFDSLSSPPNRCGIRWWSGGGLVDGAQQTGGDAANAAADAAGDATDLLPDQAGPVAIVAVVLIAARPLLEITEEVVG
jgi:hypothetical protein